MQEHNGHLHIRVCARNLGVPVPIQTSPMLVLESIDSFQTTPCKLLNDVFSLRLSGRPVGKNPTARFISIFFFSSGKQIETFMLSKILKTPEKSR